MKRVFVTPLAQVICVESTDVIATSGFLGEQDNWPNEIIPIN